MENQSGACILKDAEFPDLTGAHSSIPIKTTHAMATAVARTRSLPERRKRTQFSSTEVALTAQETLWSKSLKMTNKWKHDVERQLKQRYAFTPTMVGRRLHSLLECSGLDIRS